MIRTKNLNKVFRTGELKSVVLNNINIEINKGEYVSILGPSGSGKTSLINVIGLLDAPSSGQVFFKDVNVSQFSEKQRLEARKGKISYLFKDFKLIDELTIAENIELPLIYQNISRKERTQRTTDLLYKLNLAHRKNQFPDQLSYGQQQLTAIARALIIHPHAIIADEPTGRLNSEESNLILNKLGEINEEGTTIVLTTHSESIANKSQRVIHLFDGHVLSENTK